MAFEGGGGGGGVEDGGEGGGVGEEGGEEVVRVEGRGEVVVVGVVGHGEGEAGGGGLHPDAEGAGEVERRCGGGGRHCAGGERRWLGFWRRWTGGRGVVLGWRGLVRTPRWVRMTFRCLGRGRRDHFCSREGTGRVGRGLELSVPGLAGGQVASVLCCSDFSRNWEGMGSVCRVLVRWQVVSLLLFFCRVLGAVKAS